MSGKLRGIVVTATGVVSGFVACRVVRWDPLPEAALAAAITIVVSLIVLGAMRAPEIG